MNWGKAILLFFLCYVPFLVFVVIQSRQVDHSLVMDDYYAHDLAYQEHYDQVYNRGMLKDDLEILNPSSEDAITLDFGEHVGDIQATVYFYNARDKSLDHQEDVSVPQSECCTSVSTIDKPRGLWTAEVRWIENDVKFYKKEKIYLQ